MRNHRLYNQRKTDMSGYRSHSDTPDNFFSPTSRFVRWVKNLFNGFFSFVLACITGVIIAAPILLWLGFWVAVVLVALHFIGKYW